ncbi:MAG: PIN domain-containing protein [Alphaproteobacteria bacterium]|nr:PIN domain-containing protein [Alphaproteobacteria bacterium]
MIVVDASVAAKWFFHEKDSDLAIEILGQRSPMIAPDLILVEAGNIAWRHFRTGKAPKDMMVRLPSELTSYFDQIVPSQRCFPTAMEVATVLDHPVYDCVYLALAEKAETMLITADRRFHKRVQGSPWQERVRLLGT